MIVFLMPNGNIVKTVPDRFYQGSNKANQIILISGIAQNLIPQIAFKLPQTGLYTSWDVFIPIEEKPEGMGISAWTYDVGIGVTSEYGNVEYQLKIEDTAGNIVASELGSFYIERGVLEQAPDEAPTNLWESLKNLYNSMYAIITNNDLSAKSVLKYDETYQYPINSTIYDAETGQFYTSLVDKNLDNPLTDTTKWKQWTFAKVEEVDNKISTHNTSKTAHSDILNSINELTENVEDNTDNIAQNVQEINTLKSNIQSNTTNIANLTQNLSNNYYTKSQTYNKSEVNSLLGTAASLQFTIVDELPIVGDSTKIYLLKNNDSIVAQSSTEIEINGETFTYIAVNNEGEYGLIEIKDNEGNEYEIIDNTVTINDTTYNISFNEEGLLVLTNSADFYDEYIWLDSENRYELIGSTQIDLEGYATEEEVKREIENIDLSNFVDLSSDQSIGGNKQFELLEIINNEQLHWEEGSVEENNIQNASFKIVYSGEKFVGVWSGSYFTKGTSSLVSEDGISWKVYEMPSGNWSNIAYGNGMFIAIDIRSSDIVRSLDGMNWEIQQTSSNLSGLSSIAFQNGMFVAINSSNKNGVHSIDGINWTYFDNLPTSLSVDLVGGNGKFVYIYDVSSSNTFYYTEDLSNWKEINVLTQETEVSRDFKFINNRFVNIRSSYNTSIGSYGLWSEDAINWTTFSLPELQTGTWSDIIGGNGYYILISWTEGIFAYTKDLTNWTFGQLLEEDFSGLSFGNHRITTLSTTTELKPTYLNLPVNINVKDELKNLQNQITTVEDDVKSLQIDLSSETNARSSEDSSLQNQINKAVLFTKQTLTFEEQAQARANIGAGSSDFSGSYSELTNKPIINTNNSSSLSTNQNETIEGTVNFHKVSKTGNFTDLNNITQASNAQAGIIQIATDSEASAGSDTTKAITPAQLKTAIGGLGTVFDLKGSVQSQNNLPTTGNETGDVWYVIDENVGYIWLNDGTTDRWEQLGLPVDLSGYVQFTDIINNLTSTAIDKALSAYQGNLLNTAINNEISARQTADSNIQENLNEKVNLSSFVLDGTTLTITTTEG